MTNEFSHRHYCRLHQPSFVGHVGSAMLVRSILPGVCVARSGGHGGSSSCRGHGGQSPVSRGGHVPVRGSHGLRRHHWDNIMVLAQDTEEETKLYPVIRETDETLIPFSETLLIIS